MDRGLISLLAGNGMAGRRTKGTLQSHPCANTATTLLLPAFCKRSHLSAKVGVSAVLLMGSRMNFDGMCGPGESVKFEETYCYDHPVGLNLFVATPL